MEEPQSSMEEKDNHSILKDYFLSKTDPSAFTSIAQQLCEKSNRSLIFPALKPINYFLPQPRVSCRSDSSLEANLNCCHKSEV